MLHYSVLFCLSLLSCCNAFVQNTVVALPKTFEKHASPIIFKLQNDFALSMISESAVSVDSPSDLISEVNIDYVPLATMLATGDFKSADQFTREAIIRAAGDGSSKRGFVYFTEVKKIPNADMATIEKLWLKHSQGKFGWSVQADIWRRNKGDFENFCGAVGWNTKNEEVERKLRWFGANEFIYDLERAPKGHLPLTSALRGTQLLKAILTHPVWQTQWNEK